MEARRLSIQGKDEDFASRVVGGFAENKRPISYFGENIFQNNQLALINPIILCINYCVFILINQYCTGIFVSHYSVRRTMKFGTNAKKYTRNEKH